MKTAVRVLAILSIIGCAIAAVIFGVLIGSVPTVVDQLVKEGGLAPADADMAKMILNAVFIALLVSSLLGVVMPIINIVILSKRRDSATPYVVSGIVTLVLGLSSLISIISGILMITYGSGHYYEAE